MTDQPQAYVNNGKRIALSLPDFDGNAGFVQRAKNSALIAYLPNKSGKVDIGTIIPVDGVDWHVTKREASPFVRRMIVLTLESEG